MGLQSLTWAEKGKIAPPPLEKFMQPEQPNVFNEIHFLF